MAKKIDKKTREARIAAIHAMADAKRWELAGSPVPSIGEGERGLYSDVKKYPPHVFKTSDVRDVDLKDFQGNIIPEQVKAATEDLPRQSANQRYLRDIGIGAQESKRIKLRSGKETLVSPLIETVDDAVKKGDLSPKKADKMMEKLHKDLEKKGLSMYDLNEYNAAYDKKADKLVPFDVSELATANDEYFSPKGGLESGKLSRQGIEHNIATKAAEKADLIKSPKLSRMLSKGAKALPFVGPAIGAAAMLGGAPAEAAMRNVNPLEDISESVASQDLEDRDLAEHFAKIREQLKKDGKL